MLEGSEKLQELLRLVFGLLKSPALSVQSSPDEVTFLHGLFRYRVAAPHDSHTRRIIHLAAHGSSLSPRLLQTALYPALFGYQDPNENASGPLALTRSGKRTHP